MTATGLFPMLLLVVQWFGGIFAGLVLGALFFLFLGMEANDVEPPEPVQKQSYPVPSLPAAPAPPSEGMV